MQAGLLTLPVRQRQAVVLRHIEELGNVEIGQIMEISVESLTARGKRALRVALVTRAKIWGIVMVEKQQKIDEKDSVLDGFFEVAKG